ncbi:HEPN domain-containing protein [uncultured Rothia sp.]|uniref:ApeA N-terminal domain 1-containing protein n=1 Tax=uncultured Rothia sp. TaxID=316088 RepID=UPI00288B577F|nr:HEPN domain-containing protein [uncultured Rothia sp.]
MSDNTLEIGQVRVGWLYPGEVKEGAGIPATLVREGHRVQALIPVEGWRSSNPAARWGTEGIVFDDDPERTEYQYDVPGNMYFIDNHGMVLLIGCRDSGFKKKFISVFQSLGGILQKISVEAAIFSSRAYNTNSFNGYRTEIENLSQWFHMDTLKTKSVYEEKDSRYRIKYVETRASSVGEIIIDESRRLKFKSDFTVVPNSSSSKVVYESHDVLESYRDETIPFIKGMKEHDAIRDLLMISSWSVHRFISIAVSRDNDRGTSDDIAWRNVISERWETTKNIDIDNKDFIFTYNDIESDGVRKWLEISEKYPRALNPILTTIRWDTGAVENELFNLCSGVEALGRYIYQESPDKSLGGGKNGKIYLHNALQNIINQIPKGILPYVKKFENSRNGKVVNSLPEWADKINNSYNSVKHYGDEEINYKNIFESIDLLRIIIVSWVGTQLGAKPEAIRNGLLNKNYKFEKHLLPLDDAGYVIEKQEPEQGLEPAE